MDMTSVIEQLLVYEPAVSLFFYFLSDFANQSIVCTNSQFILACCTTLSHLSWVNECEFFAIVQYYTSVYMPGYTDDKWTTGTTTCPCMPYTWTRTDNTELMDATIPANAVRDQLSLTNVGTVDEHKRQHPPCPRSTWQLTAMTSIKDEAGV